MSSSHALGRTSEDLACAFLKSAGWRILERNYRAGHKEIDIIATRARVIAFVEVKARAGRGYGHPLDAVTWRKQREVAQAARAWLRAQPHSGFEVRFDAISITWSGQSHAVEHVENAWRVR